MDKHFIVLNGKRYDAVTGALLGPDMSVTSQPSRQHTPAAKAIHAPRVTSSQRLAVQHAVQTRSAQTVQPVQAPKRTTDRSHHGQPRHVAHHKAQTSQTLMRRAVHKPSTDTKIAVKQQYPLITTKSGIKVEAPKRLAHNVDESRVKRAQAVHKSNHVGRYQAAALAPVRAHVVPITVKEPAAHIAAPVAKAKPASVPKKIDIFEQAIATATSHEEKAPKGHSRRRRVANATAAFATVLVLGGVIAVLNQPTIEMQIASVQAGFQANEPRYLPEGFEKTDATVAGKSVSLNYASRNGNYTLTQESSNWDSQTLFDSITANHGDDYDVVYSNGRIIYVYGGSQASWVDGGILYKITGTAPLSNEQIVDIAGSI